MADEFAYMNSGLREPAPPAPAGVNWSPRLGERVSATEEREAWDRYAAAALGASRWDYDDGSEGRAGSGLYASAFAAEYAANAADEMLEERRKRFGGV